MKSIHKHGNDKNAFNVALGRRLCNLRLKHEKSQTYVGDRLGVSYQQVHKYETGETQVSPSQLLIYSKLFNVSVAYLYGLTTQSNDTAQLLHMDRIPNNIKVTIFELIEQLQKSYQR